MRSNAGRAEGFKFLLGSTSELTQPLCSERKPSPALLELRPDEFAGADRRDGRVSNLHSNLQVNKPNYPLHQGTRATQQLSSSRAAFCFSPAIPDTSPDLGR